MSKRSNSADHRTATAERWRPGHVVLAAIPLLIAGAVLGWGARATRVAVCDVARAPAVAAPSGAGAGPPASGDGTLDLSAAPFPTPWSVSGEVETFTADRMFERINGAAEAFLERGCRGLIYAALETPDGGFADLYLYDMGSADAALGMFAADSGMEPAVADGFTGRIAVAESTTYLASDRWYLQAYVSGVDDGTAAARLIARVVDERIHHAAAGGGETP